MVLNNFSSEQMDAFLAFFREEAIPSVSLKAMLTPVTQHWSSTQLHDELTKEHAMMHKKKEFFHQKRRPHLQSPFFEYVFGWL